LQISVCNISTPTNPVTIKQWGVGNNDINSMTVQVEPAAVRRFARLFIYRIDSPPTSSCPITG